MEIVGNGISDEPEGSQILYSQRVQQNGIRLTRSTEYRSTTWHLAPTLLRGANQQPSNLEGSRQERSKRGRKAQRRRAPATSHRKKECRKLLGEDETTKTLGHPVPLELDDAKPSRRFDGLLVYSDWQS